MYALLQRLTHSAMALTSARLLLVILALWVPAVNASVRVSADPASSSAQDRPAPDYDQQANHPAEDDDDSAYWFSQDEKEEWVDGLMPEMGQRFLSSNDQDIQEAESGGRYTDGRRNRLRIRQGEAPLPTAPAALQDPYDTSDMLEAEGGDRARNGGRNRLHSHHQEAPLATAAPPQKPWNSDGLNDNSGILEGGSGSRSRFQNHHEGPLLATAPTALQELGNSERVHLEDREKLAWSLVTNNVSCWPRLINHMYQRNRVYRNCKCTTTRTVLRLTCRLRNARNASIARAPMELYRWSRANVRFPRNVRLTFRLCPTSLTNCESVTYCSCTSLRLLRRTMRELRNRQTCKKWCAKIRIISTPGNCSHLCRRGK